MPFNPNCFSPGFNLQIRDSSALAYMIPPTFEEISQNWHESKIEAYKQAQKERAQKARKTAYSGMISSGSRKRMIKATELLCQMNPGRWITNPITGRMYHHRLTFVTLTVSNAENLTAHDCYIILLSHFLQWLRRTVRVSAYIWKAELQQRGQIHYHIVVPEFVPWMQVRKKWNSLQREAGLLNDYAIKHGHFDPNSTDVHKMRNASQGAAYVLKELGKDISGKLLKFKKDLKKAVTAGYMTEEQANEFFSEKVQEINGTTGKVWGCSENLMEAEFFTVPLSKDQHQVIASFIAGGAKYKLDDWFIVVACNSPPDQLLSQAQKTAFKLHLYCIANHEQVKAMESALLN